MFRKTVFAFASVFALALAAPASAAEVKVNCPAGATIKYEPAKSGKDLLFHTPPRVIGVSCTPQTGTTHVLSGSAFGWNAPDATFASEKAVGDFMTSLGHLIDEQSRKKTAQK